MKVNTGDRILFQNIFPVVGIGASAGGLEAFKKLISAIPLHSGMAYVLVQHLSADTVSALPKLLQKVTAIPVVEISDNTRVEPDHIYILPANKMMVAYDGMLQLSPRPHGAGPNLPIDLFFTSLAEVYQSHSIGVVLSGTASDGTAGLMAIKDHGGITFVQDSASATYEGMPHSAAEASVVDFILPPEEIVKKILEIKKGVIRSDEELQNPSQEEGRTFKEILSLLHTGKGTDFTYYKQPTVRRRILRRMALSRHAEPAAYLTYLQDSKAEQQSLYQDLLISVTAFFRDHEVFEGLCETALPHIVQAKKSDKPIRLWSAGCSTGQEAYSLAICLKELIGESRRSVQIFASDISEPSIAKARTGIYTKHEIAGVSEGRLQEFFKKTGAGYQVNKDIREMCVFAVHNFLKDPPFGKLDLISCRNVLIYMEPYLQKKALSTFHYSLAPNGFLLLGKAETVSSAPELFAGSGKADKLFSRKDLPGKFMHVATGANEQVYRLGNGMADGDNKETDFQKTADDIILSKYTPAGVVVNERMDIVHFRGNTTDYLEQSPGKPSHNLLKMAKDGLAFELRCIIQKVKKETTTIVKEAIQMEIAGIPHIIRLEALPLPNMVEPHYLVLFHATPDPERQVPADADAARDLKALHIEQLEKELVHLRESMRSITEEQEEANSDLQSANEELLSGSEELQSLNEELETSKEELQSTNEALSSLNKQITEAHHFSESIFSTIHEPLLVLDKDLRVKTANNAFYTMFRVDMRDTEGLLIYELGNRQWDIPALRTMLVDVLPKSTKITNFEVVQDFPAIGTRIMLLNAFEMTVEDAVEKLILLAIEDITDRRQHQLREQELLNKFQNAVVKAPVAICILKGADYRIELANDFFRTIVGEENYVLGKSLFESLPRLKTQGIKELLDKVMVSGMPLFGYELELPLVRNKQEQTCIFNVVYQPMPALDKSAHEVMVVFTEITEQVNTRKKMEAQTVMTQTLLMTAPGFICTLVGPGHVYELVNERYQQLFGNRRLKGLPILEALPELKGQGIIELLDKVYLTGKPYVGMEVPLSVVRDDEETRDLRYFNFSYQPIYNETQEIHAILVFGYEVTEQIHARNHLLETQQKRAAELEKNVLQRTLELRDANELLLQKNNEFEKINRELESFTYISSHDLQEPLRKIQTFSARILAKDYHGLSDDSKDCFRRMQSAASRMQALLDDLLAYSHASPTDQEFEKLDLNKLLEDVKAELSDSIIERHALIEAGRLDDVMVNASQFRQVISNLLGNALKFSRPGVPPPLISIKTRVAKGLELRHENPDLPEGRIDAEKDYCRISIRDNGIGFDPLYKKRIFEVFQRLNSQETYTGTGIGLAIVKKIVEHHFGFVTATGALNEGATFDIYIPAR